MDRFSERTYRISISIATRSMLLRSGLTYPVFIYSQGPPGGILALFCNQAPPIHAQFGVVPIRK
jgi:hypothetical protein